MFSTLKQIPVALLQLSNFHSHLADIQITEKNIKEASNDMNVASAQGLDGITAGIYEEYTDQLVHPVVKIWNTFLLTRELGIVQTIIASIYKEIYKMSWQTTTL